MPLTRAYEEQEVAPDIRRIYHDIRDGFDLPFVDTAFKLCAGVPEYLEIMWRDLGHVARSKEFHAAVRALDEFIGSAVIANGWRFGDQARLLAGHKFSSNDIGQFAAIVNTLNRGVLMMTLFTRLMQRGYSGGQKGKITGTKQASAVSQLITLHLPPESEAGLRTWLIYSDIKRTLSSHHVFSLFRVMSPYPGYLGAVWLDSKRLMGNPKFARVREDVVKRAMALLTGLPVKDHRALAKTITAEQWREIEETVDGISRVLPQLAIVAEVWRRSFATAYQIIAA